MHLIKTKTVILFSTDMNIHTATARDVRIIPTITAAAVREATAGMKPQRF